MSVPQWSDGDWNSRNKSGLVDIGTHKLWLSVYGSIRRVGEPLIIILPGLASSTTGWSAVCRGLSNMRVLQYERSGYGASEESSARPTAANIARDLDLLLKHAQLPPPFVIVAHSWGGIISREFLALRPDDVQGMVFVDANQEKTLQTLDWRKLAMSDVVADVDANQAIGLPQRHKLTTEEWNAYQDEQNSEKQHKQAVLEFTEYPHSFNFLASKRQLGRVNPMLGNRPVYVIKGDAKSDFEMFLRVGMARGNGSDASLSAFEDMLSTWDEKDRALQSEILSLSNMSKYVEIEGSGHNVHLTEPQAIVDGMRWVLEHCK